MEWILAGVLVALIIMLSTRLFAAIEFSFSLEKLKIHGSVSALGITVYKKTNERDTPGIDAQIQTIDQDWLHVLSNKSDTGLIEFLIHSRNLLSSILNRLRISKLSWQTSLGMKEADLRAITAGGLWAIKSTVLGFLSYSAHFKHQPTINVESAYENVSFSTQLNCRLSMTIGQILYCVYLFLRGK